MGNHNTNNGYTVSDDRYAPTSWGRPDTSNEPFEFTTPSGQICLIRRLGMDDILRMGMVDKLDFFSKSMSEDDAEKPNEAREDEIKKSVLSNFGQMDDAIGAIVVAGVIAPSIQPTPDHAALKKAGVIYVDSIPFNDRVALFSEILDTEGLSTFRKESEDGVGDVPAEQVVQLPA